MGGFVESVPVSEYFLDVTLTLSFAEYCGPYRVRKKSSWTANYHYATFKSIFIFRVFFKVRLSYQFVVPSRDERTNKIRTSCKAKDAVGKSRRVGPITPRVFQAGDTRWAQRGGVLHAQKLNRHAKLRI